MTDVFWSIVACSVASYLLGAVPCGYLIARSRGIDIRRTGSGNIGATNVFRFVGKGWGLITFFGDILKGFVAAFFFPIIAGHVLMRETGQTLPVVCACLVVIGHNWPVYLHFKGGKGIATSAGALLGIAPVPLGIGLLSWIIVFPLSRYVSLASITAGLVMPAAGWFLYYRQSEWIQPGLLIPMLLTALGLLGILRHWGNIQRLMNGTENRFEFGRKR